MPVKSAESMTPDIAVPVVVIGAGACGLVSAMTVADSGVPVIVLERDPVPQGSTALSSGMIPACRTALQAAKGVEDGVELMLEDLVRKAKGESDPAVARRVCEVSGPTIDWLTRDKGIDLELVEGFLYPGHSALRMHAPPSKTGAELIGSLANACAVQGIDILTDALVLDLFADGDERVRAVEFIRPDRSGETVGCDALVLACNGFGGNPQMVREHIPEIAGAVYCGHAGNTGDAVRWGAALGAALEDMGSFQGHGSVAYQHNILITWALMMEGGIQVNAEGRRFSNEHAGYSEQAKIVAAQPGAVAWDVYDARLHALGRSFEDYREAEAAGAVLSAPTVEALAETMGVPAAALAQTVEETRVLAAGDGADPYGRDFTRAPPLAPPYYAVKVSGALFHTQGGLAIDPEARVLRPDGSQLPNLLAGGGAARGLSGRSDYGYLSGNGLLSAVMLGRIAGTTAARLAGKPIRSPPPTSP